LKKKILKISIGVIVVVALAAWLGLPVLVKALGLHPEYEGQRYMLPQGRALIICTSHDRLGDDGPPTGVFGSELTAPYYEFLDGRMSVDVASIKGGKIPIDPLSFKWFIKSEYDDRFMADDQFRSKVENSLKIDDIDFTRYDMIYLAGGWGAAYDLGFSEELGRKITEAYAAGKVVGGVCHGPLGLLLATDENGRPLVKEKHMTAVTDKQVKELDITQTPMHPERELRAAGALFESGTAFRDMFANHTVVDGRIVTGQNQNAGAETANKMIMVAGGLKR
jgi:putative intracellular protease/amidase